jgi:hypothetical protein
VHQQPPPRRKGLSTQGTVLLCIAIVAGLIVVPVVIAVAVSAGNRSSTSSSAATTPATAAPAVPSLVPTPAPPVPLTPHRKITAREWALIAKDPNAHTGERIIVYGEVTQSDAATGTQFLRANIDGVEHKPSYGFADYPTNTMLSGTVADFSNVVVDDLFRAEVTVLGSMTYDTQIGGSTTVPQLAVNSIKIIGSTS